MDYEAMLDKAREALPDSVLVKERFEIPKVKGFVQGNKTVVENFSQIVSTLHREPEHVLKFLLRELATPGETRASTLVLGSKVGSAKINEKIKQYANDFVFCTSCGKPDTEILKEGNVAFLKCHVCGSKSVIKGRNYGII